MDAAVDARSTSSEHVNNEGDDDANDSYEDVEARLQQERIDHLQTMRKRELEDAETARKMMQDELLQIEREKLCRVMQDEDLARRLQSEEQERRGTTQTVFVYDETNDASLSDDSEDRDLTESLNGQTNVADFDNAIYFTGTPVDDTDNDEMLAQALQQTEHEAASQSASRITEQRAQLHDAYLARIIQNTERISAMRRQMSQSSPPAGIVQRQMSLPNQPMSRGAEVSTTPGGAMTRRSQSETVRTDRVPPQTNGTEDGATSTTVPQGGATSTTGAQGGSTPTRAKRHKSKRKAKCKQQ